VSWTVQAGQVDRHQRARRRRAVASRLVPVTSIVTVVRYGPARGAVIHFQNGTSTPISVAEISDYVSEAGNPGNTKAVSTVETIVPAPLLASGLCLVDTPGVGSVFEDRS
jgi:dynamin family protein